MSLLHQLTHAYLGQSTIPFLVGRLLPEADYIVRVDQLYSGGFEELLRVQLDDGEEDNAFVVCHRQSSKSYQIGFPPTMGVTKTLNCDEMSWSIVHLPPLSDPFLDMAGYASVVHDRSRWDEYFHDSLAGLADYAFEDDD